jgi:hypothetical protein
MIVLVRVVLALLNGCLSCPVSSRPFLLFIATFYYSVPALSPLVQVVEMVEGHYVGSFCYLHSRSSALSYNNLMSKEMPQLVSWA